MTQHDDAAGLVSQDALESKVPELLAPAERPTLMGLAPLESTVRPLQLLASEEAEHNPGQAPRADEGDSEWLDLSTSWLITGRPAAAQPSVDPNEVTEHFQWADRLAVPEFPRAETLSSTAPPPPQPHIAAPPGRRVTMAFGRPSDAAGGPMNPGPLGAQAFEASRQWVPAGGRHATLAGSSALAEDRSSWSAQEAYAMPPLAAAPTAAPRDVAPAWRDSESSPPWAARSPRPHGYVPDERRASHPTFYPPYYAAPRRGPGPRRPLRNSPAWSLERWMGNADVWGVTLFKCAIGLMLLHYSGLAVPVLALFGYAPAQPASAAARSEAAVQPAVPVAAMYAAPSGRAERVSPALDEDTSTVGSLRPKRAASSTHHAFTQHHSSKPANRQAQSASVAAPRAALEPKRASLPLPPIAAEAEAEDAAGEAFLRINSRPWSQVFVDGTHVGHTPKLDLRVRAGAHRIRLVNQELGVSKTIELRAVAGETVSHVEFLEE